MSRRSPRKRRRGQRRTSTVRPKQRCPLRGMAPLEQRIVMAADRRQHCIGIDTRFEQPANAIGKRRWLRRRRGIPLIVTSPSNPMVLLGDIGQRQEVRKGASSGEGRFDWKLRQRLFHRLEIRGVTIAGPFRQRSDAFDRVIDVASLDLLEYLTQQ